MDVHLKTGHFDLVVLDVMMPGEDGLAAARRLAASDGPPILMLSALGEDTDRIVGLEIGADVFDPFTRLETARSRDTGGVGLGLPITRAIFRAHRGGVCLSNLTKGGLRATATLPRSQHVQVSSKS